MNGLPAEAGALRPVLGGERGWGLNTRLSQSPALHVAGPEPWAGLDRQDGPRVSDEEAALGASRKAFCPSSNTLSHPGWL